MNARVVSLFFATGAWLFFEAKAVADDGYWVTPGSGSWANANNWDSNVIADGADNTAYFGITLFADIPASATFSLDRKSVV